MGMPQGSKLSHFLFALVVDVTEFADDLFLMSKTIEGFRNKFLK